MKTYLDESLSFEERAEALVKQMTLEEKIFQTLHTAPAIERLDVDGYNWWNEALHGVARAGVATVFPQAIGLAATFDEDLMEEVAESISTEARAKFNMQKQYGDTDIYKGLTFFSPNVNIFRDPRWGRGHETYGEDPYLTSRLGVRFIKGMQGDGKYLKTAACAKHYAVHSGPEDIRHSFDAVVSKQDLNETYLPAFKACVQEAKVESVMGAYNRVNGEACCGSKTLLQDILRDDWGFEGYVTSDCWAIKDFHEFHMVTNTPVESVALAINNGCDNNCGNIYSNLLLAVRDGLVKEETIDLSVKRLFTTRMKLGLFDNPEEVPFNKIGYEFVDSKEQAAFNLEVAKKSIVLLKNEGNMLPLNLDSIKTIGVIGPNADNRKALVGNYEGTSSEYITILEGIKHYVGDSKRVYFSEGCHLFKDKVSGLGIKNDRIAEVQAVAAMSDVVIACFGLDPGLEGEEGDQGNEFASGDKVSLNLPGIQEDVLRTLYSCGKPVVLVLLSGSALAVPWAQEHIPAILQGWYPGARGGEAIAELLFGDASPEGKLPVTFYKTTEELPAFVDYSMKNRTYRYMEQEALYPFGYGLSYTNFELDQISLNTNIITKELPVICRLRIKNIGKMAGGETIQAYVSVNDVPDAPIYQLKALKKVFLKPMEEQIVELSLDAKSFGLFDKEGELILNKGQYTVFIGTGQPDERTKVLSGKESIALQVICNERTII